MAVLRRTPTRHSGAGNTVTGPEWEQVFHLLKVRSGVQCEGRTPWCLAPSGSVSRLPRERISIQHRRARGMGGAGADAHNLANLLLLCGTGVTGCHGWVEIGERNLAERRGLWVRHDHDDRGSPVPVEQYPLVLWSGRRVLLHPTDPLYVRHADEWGVADMLVLGRHSGVSNQG